MKNVKQISILFTVAVLLGLPGYVQVSFGYTYNDDFSVDTTGNYETFQLNYGSVVASVQTQYDSANQKAILNTVGGYNYGFMKTKENSLIAAGTNFDFSVNFETLTEYTTSIYLGDMQSLSSSNFIELRADSYAQQLYVNYHEGAQAGQILFRTPYGSRSGKIEMKRENGNYSFYYNDQSFASTRFDQFNDLSFNYAVVNYTSSGPPAGLTATSTIDNWHFSSTPEPATLLILGLGGLILRKRRA
jgi:hypothetical protein